MMNTLLGVGIGYLIFKWADSEPSKGPNGDEKPSEPQDPTPPQREGVWTLESVSSVSQDPNSGLFYACGTYAWDEGRTGTYRYIVVQAEERGSLSNWSELMGSDGSIAYTFAMKSDCEAMVRELTKEPEPDAPKKQPEPEEEKPSLPPSEPLPDWNGGLGGSSWDSSMGGAWA